MDIKFITIGIALLIQAGGIVWWASSLQASVRHNLFQIQMLEKDVAMHSAFVRDWPIGKLGRLPDDVDQSLRITWLERQMEQLNKEIFHMNGGKAN
jgi:hypothetical protein